MVGLAVAMAASGCGSITGAAGWERVGPNVVCTADLRASPRTVPMRFDTPGEATIRVVGRTNHPRGAARYEVRVQVRP